MAAKLDGMHAIHIYSHFLSLQKWLLELCPKAFVRP